MEQDNGSNVLIRFHEVEMETTKAKLIFVSPDDLDGTWIPKSQIAHIDEDTGEMWIPLWLAESHGLDYS